MRLWKWIKGLFKKEESQVVQTPLIYPQALASQKPAEIRRKARKLQREARRKNR